MYIRCSEKHELIVVLETILKCMTTNICWADKSRIRFYEKQRLTIAKTISEVFFYVSDVYLIAIEAWLQWTWLKDLIF